MLSKLSSLAPQSLASPPHTQGKSGLLFSMSYAHPMPNHLLFSPLFQLNLFSGLILTENHMACDIMGAGSRAKGKDRAEKRDRTARSPCSDVSRQACWEAHWGWGGSRLEVLWVFLDFTPTWIIREEWGGGLWTVCEPFYFRDLSPCCNIERLPSFTSLIDSRFYIVRSYVC